MNYIFTNPYRGGRIFIRNWDLSIFLHPSSPVLNKFMHTQYFVISELSNNKWTSQGANHKRIPNILGCVALNCFKFKLKCNRILLKIWSVWNITWVLVILSAYLIFLLFFLLFLVFYMYNFPFIFYIDSYGIFDFYCSIILFNIFLFCSLIKKMTWHIERARKKNMFSLLLKIVFIFYV